MNAAVAIDVSKLNERLWLAKFSRPEYGCWIWTAAVNNNGYGQIRVGGINVLAHRVSYTMYVGPIAEGLVLDHLCRTPACVRPDHLEAVEQKVNMERTRRTHCPRGHEYVGDNVMVKRDGSRDCRTCKNLLFRAHYASGTASRAPIKHGTPGGYTAHKRRGEAACEPCRKARVEYEAQLRERRRNRSTP